MTMQVSTFPGAAITIEMMLMATKTCRTEASVEMERITWSQSDDDDEGCVALTILEPVTVSQV